MKKASLLFAALLAAAVAFGQQAAKVAAGPWLQAVSENEFTVVWVTDTAAVSWVELAPDDGSHFYAEQRPRYYQSVFGRRPVGTLHSVRIAGLEPATTYRYRIMMQGAEVNPETGAVRFARPTGSRVYKHEPYSVTTLDPEKKSVKFAVGNDFHDDNETFRALFGAIAEGGYDFVCLNGDMNSTLYGRNTILDGYLRSASEMFASGTPLYMARGNHENRGPFAIHFMDYFPSLSGMPYYAFRQGPAFFIVLDCGEDKPDSDIEYGTLTLSDQFREQEAQWLRGIVRSDEFRNAPYKIVFCHMPPSERGWHGDREINRLFVPLLDEAGIDLMISGHIHKYKFEEKGHDGRSFPLLCNPNRARLDALVSEKDGIDIRIYDKSGQMIKQHSIKK